MTAVTMVDDDPLNSSEFDPVDYLNHHFPTERSLDRLEPFMSNIAVQIGDLGDEISKTVQGQSEAGHQATRDVDEAKAAIRELFEKIRDMKAKAEQSEVMVQEICRDIKQLDFAKRHLQTTITALKRLHMLVTAVDQLQGVAKAKHYRESANLLDAVRQLLTHFESYSQVRGVRSIVMCRNKFFLGYRRMCISVASGSLVFGDGSGKQVKTSWDTSYHGGTIFHNISTKNRPSVCLYNISIVCVW